MKKILVFLGVGFLMLSADGIARLASGPAKENAHGIESKQPVYVVNPPVSSPCGSGLAAQDLAGVCRAKPKPTPGALEAVGELKSSKTKTQTNPGSKKKLPPETRGSF
ncbi:MAG TPA: hypothetical protein VLB06_11665 [Sulfuricaulis sp.]|nr:hypothetical protein [Sulfuricaulis sp.]